MHPSDHMSTRTFKANRCRACGIVLGFGDRCDWCQHRPPGHVDAPGEYRGRHHSEWIGTVQVLVDEDDVHALQLLLPRLVVAATAEAEATGRPSHGWFDEQLAQLEERNFGVTPTGRTRDSDAA
ncbi:MAG: hypothetical protein ACKOVH_00730 [Actinomycetota bacterium]